MTESARKLTAITAAAVVVVSVVAIATLAPRTPAPDEPATVARAAAPEPVDTTATPMTPETAGELTAMAIAQACGSDCTLLSVYVYDNLRTADTPMSQEEPIPESTRLSITNRFASVQFVDMGQQEALFRQDGLVDGGDGVLISVGPVENLAPGVEGIEVAVQLSRFDGHGQTVQFQWTGERWELATSDDTGVTVTTSVS